MDRYIVGKVNGQYHVLEYDQRKGMYLAQYEIDPELDNESQILRILKVISNSDKKQSILDSVKTDAGRQ